MENEVLPSQAPSAASSSRRLGGVVVGEFLSFHAIDADEHFEQVVEARAGRRTRLSPRGASRNSCRRLFTRS